MSSNAHAGEPIEIRRKRLIHRSRYTGMKETDLLLGAFAQRYVPGFDTDQLDAYERLLEETDADLRSAHDDLTLPQRVISPSVMP